MNIETATVLSNEQIYENGHLIWFHAPQIVSAKPGPGQFVMVHCSPGGADPLFARAFSFHRLADARFALLFAVVGRGTEWLASRRRGDGVCVYGPLGKGYRLPRENANLLLIGGGVGVAPLVDLAERAVVKGHQVVAMMGARSASGLLPASAWPREVEYVTVTEDGSAGLRGRVTDHLGPYQEWASKLYACGPNAMYRSLASTLRGNGRRQRPEILMEEAMPCGWGMCYGCAVFTKHGVRLCCKDGPRFNLFDVF
ncbi:MAG: dihydroorotate dehydrogenase electron transfer subunit [Dehalococcoidia bacterium]